MLTVKWKSSQNFMLSKSMRIISRSDNVVLSLFKCRLSGGKDRGNDLAWRLSEGQETGRFVPFEPEL